jgi:hypothetical protein
MQQILLVVQLSQPVLRLLSLGLALCTMSLLMRLRGSLLLLMLLMRTLLLLDQPWLLRLLPDDAAIWQDLQWPNLARSQPGPIQQGGLEPS